MKHLYRALMVIALLLSVAAKAEESKGIEEAEEVCESMLLNADKDACMKVVSKADYFNTEAVEVCGSVLLNNVKISCLKAIADRSFTEKAVQECGSRLLNDAKISCFEASGRPYWGNFGGKSDKGAKGVDKKYVRTNLKKALEFLKDRKYEKAEGVLESVIESLEE